jgi:hypothetical protein
MSRPKSVVFAGYAPVHFVCFQPIYRRLVRTPGVEVYLSGGSDRDANGTVLDAATLYRPFRVPRDRVLPLAEMRRRSFDMVFCAHVSGYFPRSDRARVQLFHGLSFRNMAVRRDVLVYDHLFITGPYMMRAFQENGLLRPGDPRCVPIGFPKVDRLVDGSLDRRAILRRLGFSGRRPVVLYAPTGQRRNSLEIGLGEEVMRRLAATGRYDLIVKLHDHPRDRSVDWVARMRGHRSARIRLLPDYDIVPYLYAADLLITDASSVSSEYSLLNRPMVFLDVPELLAAARAKGGALDLETWGRKGGVTVRWPDEAVDAVAWSLAHPRRGSAVRRAMARDLFYNPGRATDVAVGWIRDRLGLAPPSGETARGRPAGARRRG